MFHPGNHAFSLKQPHEPEGRRRAPVPETSQAPNAYSEFSAGKSGINIVDTGCQNVRQVQPCLEAREFFPRLAKKRIGPDFSPNQRVSAIHLVTLSEAFSKLKADFSSIAVDISAKCRASFVPNLGSYSG